ncbi:hypothetical protein DFH06DRAFT_1318111 [Mycena polygramma]|nr:hypothetical protein DFH06DRAFT_1318111 [Mycena polygramma]
MAPARVRRRSHSAQLCRRMPQGRTSLDALANIRWIALLGLDFSRLSLLRCPVGNRNGPKAFESVPPDFHLDVSLAV